MRRSQIDPPVVIDPLLARGLNETAVAASGASPGADETVKTRGVVRPDDDLAAIASAEGVGVDLNIGPDISAGGVLDLSVAAMQIAAD